MEPLGTFNSPLRSSPAKGASGFSLVELVIAAFLAVVISAMMFAVLNNQETAARRNDSNAEMQENLRYALHVMARQIRMAGYGVGYRLAGSDRLNDVPTLLATNNLGWYHALEAGATDQLMVIYRNPAQEFELATKAYQLNPANCNTNILVSQATGGDGFEGASVALMPEDTIVCLDDGTQYHSTGYAWTVADPSQTGGIEEAGEVPRGGSVSVKTNNNKPFTDLCLETLPVFMTCGSLVGSTIGFYIYDNILWMDDDGDSLQVLGPDSFLLEQGSGLVGGGTGMNDIPLAKGIEDMQISFCMPGYPNPSPSDSMVAKGLEQCMSQPESADWRSADFLDGTSMLYVRAIRITLVARGRNDPNTGGRIVSVRPQIEDHYPPRELPSETSDVETYPRMIQSVVVQVPNIRYRVGLTNIDTSVGQ